jgi:hypothetical protein
MTPQNIILAGLLMLSGSLVLIAGIVLVVVRATP